MSYFESKPFILFDGAMGTYFALKNKRYDMPCELANLDEREKVFSIHKEYIEAGADAIKTNTFGANRTNFGEKFSNIIKAGYKIAGQAAENTKVKVFADIGPVNNDDGNNNSAELMEIADVFLWLGAENFIFETFSSAEGILKTAQYIKEKQPNVFILAQFAVSPDGYTSCGVSGKKIFEQMAESPYIDAHGFNCVCGPAHLLNYIKTFDINNRYISIMPNAGYPSVINSRTVYDTSPEYFAEKLAAMRDYGVKILGGCCGTTPAHIELAAKTLKTSAPEMKTPIKYAEKEKLYKIKTNLFYDKLQKGEKVIAVELDPPADINVDFLLNAAKTLKKAGADIITVADCPIASARADSSMMAAKLQREANIQVMPHLTCRDRNINATKALLLGLNIEDVQNILIITGDPLPQVDRGQVKVVFNRNSVQMAEYVKDLNDTVFAVDPFRMAAALNVNALNFASELKRAEAKIKAGVSLFLTQPIYSDEAIANLQKAKQTLNAKILAGIMPLVSYRNACFINNEVSGITIPDDLINRYKDKTREEAVEIALAVSLEIAKKTGPYIDGYYIVTPLKRVDIVGALLQKLLC
ncbi:MAG: bifunctional homocysteine S-methyltransferase/methylenetetrahydrofolate reductase [Clostridia bacterium]|nr:bifunctional homocysteine S-methyltransferase/methylenetetrahydrofolate reductase [Clostridia bacterium]